jgi:hypothetical protein
VQVFNSRPSNRGIDSKRARQPTSWGLLKILKSSSTSLLLVREGHGILEIDDERVGLCLTRAAKPISFRRWGEEPAFQRENRPVRFAYCHHSSPDSRQPPIEMQSGGQFNALNSRHFLKAVVTKILKCRNVRGNKSEREGADQLVVQVKTNLLGRHKCWLELSLKTIARNTTLQE